MMGMFLKSLVLSLGISLAGWALGLVGDNAGGEDTCIGNSQYERVAFGTARTSVLLFYFLVNFFVVAAVETLSCELQQFVKSLRKNDSRVDSAVLLHGHSNLPIVGSTSSPAGYREVLTSENSRIGSAPPGVTAPSNDVDVPPKTAEKNQEEGNSEKKGGSRGNKKKSTRRPSSSKNGVPQTFLPNGVVLPSIEISRVSTPSLPSPPSASAQSSGYNTSSSEGDNSESDSSFYFDSEPELEQQEDNMKKNSKSHLRKLDPHMSQSSPSLLLREKLVKSNASNSSLSSSKTCYSETSSPTASAENSPRRIRRGSSLIIQDKVRWYDDLVKNRKIRQELLDSIQTRVASEDGQPHLARNIRITSSSPFISEAILPENKRRSSDAKTDEETDQLLLEQELKALMKERKVKLNLKEFNSRQKTQSEGISWRILSSNVREVDICGHSSTPFGNTLVVIGGTGPNSAFLQISFFDTENNVWSSPTKCTGLKLGSMWNHQTTRIGDKFYSFGGYVDEQLSNTMYILALRDDGTAHWSKARIKKNLPSPREGHSFSRYGKKFILFGGHNGFDYLSDVHVYDSDSATWTQMFPSHSGTTPYPRKNHSAVVLNDKLVIFGGIGRNEVAFNDVWILHLEEMRWSQCTIDGASPPPISDHVMVRIGKRAIFFGGQRNEYCVSTVYLMSLAEQSNIVSWLPVLGPSPSARKGHSFNCLNGNLYVLGGINQKNLSRDIWIGDIVNMPFVATNIDYYSLEMKEELARGNFAKVYRAIWNGTEVAVKKFTKKRDAKEDHKALKDFKTEVELLSLVCHPNVMAILGYCHENQRCIVMEFLPNNLWQYIHEQTSPVPHDLKVQFASDIVRGVKYLHSHHIIHRDLKSSNLLLDRHLNVKIGDLGISRVVSLTNTMTTIGTIFWTAPEILRHEPYDERADIYSFAIVLWEICTGKEPYEDHQKNAMEIGVLVANRSIPRPTIDSSVPVEWSSLIEECWSENPTHRPSFEVIEQYIKNHF